MATINAERLLKLGVAPGKIRMLQAVRRRKDNRKQPSLWWMRRLRRCATRFDMTHPGYEAEMWPGVYGWWKIRKDD